MKFSNNLELRAAIADKMLHYGHGCTEDQLLAHFTRAQLADEGERARDEANERDERQTRARVQARRAA